MRKLRAIWSLIWCKKFYLYFDEFRVQKNLYTNDLKLIKSDCQKIYDDTFTQYQMDKNVEAVNKILQ